MERFEISNEKLSEVLEAFWKYRKMDKSYDEIVPLISHFWPGGIHSTWDLAMFITSCQDRGMTPEWFRDWMWGEDPDACPPKFGPPQVRISDSALPPSPKTKDFKVEYEELQKNYYILLRENQSLTQQLKQLHDNKNDQNWAQVEEHPLRRLAQAAKDAADFLET